MHFIISKKEIDHMNGDIQIVIQQKMIEKKVKHILMLTK